MARLPLAPAVRLPVAYLLGCWVVSMILLLLGLARVLAPGVVVGVVSLLALVGSWRRWRFGWGGAGAAAAGSAILVPVALAPPFFYDALVYHLALPWQALLERGWMPHPEDLFSTSPPLSQLVALPALALGLDRAPAAQHLLAAVVAGAAVWALSRTLGAPRWAAGLAAFCVPLLPNQAAVAGLPSAEAWAWAGLAAGLATALAPRARPAGSLLAGLLTGIACAARVQSVPLAVLVVVLAVVRGLSRRALWSAAVGFALGAVPWWLKNLVLLGAPLAPIGWPVAGLAELQRDAVSVLHVASSPGGALRIVADALAAHAAYLLPLALGVVFAVVGRGSRRLRLAAVVVLGGFVGWAAVAAVPRYLGLALVLALAVVAGLAVRRDGAVVAALVLGTVSVLSLTFSTLEVRRLGGLGLLTSPPAQVQGFWVVNNPLPAYAATVELRDDARLLLVGEPRGFGLPRRFVSPSYYDVSPLRDLIEAGRAPRAVRDSLCAEGFTHLLLNRGELARLAGGYPVAPWSTEAGRRRWEELLYWLGRPQVRRGGVDVYALDCGSLPGRS